MALPALDRRLGRNVDQRRRAGPGGAEGFGHRFRRDRIRHGAIERQLPLGRDRHRVVQRSAAERIGQRGAWPPRRLRRGIGQRGGEVGLGLGDLGGGEAVLARAAQLLLGQRQRRRPLAVLGDDQQPGGLGAAVELLRIRPVPRGSGLSAARVSAARRLLSASVATASSSPRRESAAVLSGGR